MNFYQTIDGETIDLTDVEKPEREVIDHLIRRNAHILQQFTRTQLRQKIVELQFDHYKDIRALFEGEHPEDIEKSTVFYIFSDLHAKLEAAAGKPADFPCSYWPKPKEWTGKPEHEAYVFLVGIQNEAEEVAIDAAWVQTYDTADGGSGKQIKEICTKRKKKYAGVIEPFDVDQCAFIKELIQEFGSSLESALIDVCTLGFDHGRFGTGIPDRSGGEECKQQIFEYVPRVRPFLKKIGQDFWQILLHIYLFAEHAGTKEEWLRP